MSDCGKIAYNMVVKIAFIKHYVYSDVYRYYYIRICLSSIKFTKGSKALR